MVTRSHFSTVFSLLQPVSKKAESNILRSAIFFMERKNEDINQNIFVLYINKTMMLARLIAFEQSF